MRHRRSVALLLLTTHCGLIQPDDGKDTDPPTTEGPPPPDTAETGLVRLGYAGIADVNELGLDGTETFTAVRRRDGVSLCAWVWQTRDWAATTDEPDPIALPCADPSGAPCAFAFTVTLADGAVDTELEDDRCSAFREFVPLLSRIGPYGYGYTDAYTEIPGGPSYGPALMFHVQAEPPESPYWAGYPGQATFDDTTFVYAFDLGLLPY
ncbi:MAG: hypothetical protein ACI8PZ_004119 [Myxococcota bacterium]|jgi:hypothetical protein